MRILVVEDSPKMAELIRRVLVRDGHVVDVAPDGLTALRSARASAHDAIVLDRMLPDLDGLEVLRQLREQGIMTPALVLTALTNLEHRVSGLDAGADDYLSKPFAFSELLARLRAIGRRAGRSETQLMTAGELKLDEERHAALAGERTVDLSGRELTLLSYLMRNADHVVSRRQILEAVWGTGLDVNPNIVDLYVHYLRRKLASLDRPNTIRSVRGVGYMLRSEP